MLNNHYNVYVAPQIIGSPSFSPQKRTEVSELMSPTNFDMSQFNFPRGSLGNSLHASDSPPDVSSDDELEALSAMSIAESVSQDCGETHAFMDSSLIAASQPIRTSQPPTTPPMSNVPSIDEQNQPAIPSIVRSRYVTQGQPSPHETVV